MEIIQKWIVHIKISNLRCRPVASSCGLRKKWISNMADGRHNGFSHSAVSAMRVDKHLGDFSCLGPSACVTLGRARENVLAKTSPLGQSKMVTIKLYKKTFWLPLLMRLMTCLCPAMSSRLAPPLLGTHWLAGNEMRPEHHFAKQHFKPEVW